MKTIVCGMLIACMAIIGTLASQTHPRLSSRDSTVPAFLWSRSSYLSKGQHQVQATLSSAEFEEAVKHLISTTDSDSNNQLIQLIDRESSPEAVIIFVESETRTELITKHSAKLVNLQKLIKKAYGSVEVPYILCKPHENIIASALSASSNIVLAIDESHTFTALEADSAVVKVKISELVQYLSTSNVFSNNQLDVIVVSFDWESEAETPSALSEHDDIIAKVAAVASKDTVFIYTADSVTSSNLVWSYNQNRNTYQYVNMPTADSANGTNMTNHTRNSTTINYFPGAFLEVLIVSAFFLAMLFSGGCALFGLQTPDRWDPPKALKVKEI